MNVASTHRRVKLSWKKKLFFSTVLLGLTLVLLEIGLRLTGQCPVRFVDQGMAERGIIVPDEVIGRRVVANLDIPFRYHWGDTVSIRTNASGFRDVDHDPTDGRPSILVLGDSFAWGFGVTNEEIFTRRLQEKLPDKQVINLAVTGFNTAQEHALLRQESGKYNPELVIVAFCQNDICKNQIPKLQQAKSGGARAKKRRGVKAFLARNSYLYDFVRTKCSRSKKITKFLVAVGLKEPLKGYEGLNPNLRPSLVDYPEDLIADWDATMQELQALKKKCDQMSARLLIVAIPARQTIDDEFLNNTLSYRDFDISDFDLDKPYRRIGEFCRQHSIEFVNPLPQFRNSDADLFLPNDMHFNSAGHSLFAEAVIAYLGS